MFIEQVKQASKLQRNMRMLHQRVTCDVIDRGAIRCESWDAGRAELSEAMPIILLIVCYLFR